MPEIDITLFCNDHRFNAMARALALQGMTVEQALYPALDVLYEQIVPPDERRQIEEYIADEEARRIRECEAARRFSVVHLHDADGDLHFISELHTNFYNAARLYRMVTKELSGIAPMMDRLSHAFMSHRNITPSDFSAMCQAMPNDQRITAVIEFDFEDGTVGVCESGDCTWRYYQLKDVSTAVYKAERKKGLRWSEEQAIFMEALSGKEIRIYSDETPAEDTNQAMQM
jgi:hypothetical protein